VFWRGRRLLWAIDRKLPSGAAFIGTIDGQAMLESIESFECVDGTGR
jgi:hypothetical protein